MVLLELRVLLPLEYLVWCRGSFGFGGEDLGKVTYGAMLDIESYPECTLVIKMITCNYFCFRELIF